MYKIGDKLEKKGMPVPYFTTGRSYIITGKDNIGLLISCDSINESVLIKHKLVSKYFNPIIEKKNVNELNNKLKNQKASHYNLWLDTDSIDIIKAFLTNEEYIGALKFNILKYQLRLGKKDCIESDMEKIEDYKRELNSILGAK